MLPTCINENLYYHFNDEEREMAIKRLLVSFNCKIQLSEQAYKDRVYLEDIVLLYGPDDDNKPCFTLCHTRDI